MPVISTPKLIHGIYNKQKSEAAKIKILAWKLRN